MMYPQAKFEWNKSFGGGFSYSRLLSDLGVGRDGIEPAWNMYGADMTLHGCYLGFGLGANSNSYSGTSYGMLSWNVKLGASMKYGTDVHRFYITPYIGILSIDQMGNWGRKYGMHHYQYLNYQATKAHRFLIGLKLSYAYKQIEFGGHISTNEIGLGIAWNGWNLLEK